MNLQPIVEGHGEVEAVPVLLRRLRDLAQAYPLEAERTGIASATNVREDRRCGGVPILVPARSKLEHSPSG